MCIILIKPQGIALPTSDIIRTCWKNNSDGAGIMYPYRGNVRIDKGFMKLKHLCKHLDTLSTHINVRDTTIIIHFRTSTSGHIIPGNTHPFPITRSLDELRNTHTSCSIGVAHNGVVAVTSNDKTVSDTMEYIRKQLVLVDRICPDWYRNPIAMELVENSTQSKLAILIPSGEYFTVGRFTTDAGILYSNCGYEDWYLELTEYGYSEVPDLRDRDNYVDTDLMWLAPEKHSVVFPGGHHVSSDNYLVDYAGQVYYYDYSNDTAVPLSSAHVECLGGEFEYDAEWTDSIPVKHRAKDNSYGA